jgi:urease accessory protein
MRERSPLSNTESDQAGAVATTINTVDMLSAIRFADSAFPTGGFAFSSGLEAAFLDGYVGNEAALLRVVEEQLTYRWNSFDRVFLARYFAAPTLDTAACLDAEIDRRTPVERFRVGSRRAGAALLNGFAKLGQVESARYRQGVIEGQRPGHLTIAQGVAFDGARLSLQLTEMVSAWHLISGLTGAALRLGIVGHLSTQRVIVAVLPTLATLLDLGVPVSRSRPGDTLSFSTFTEIAAARRTGLSSRLFAT